MFKLVYAYKSTRISGAYLYFPEKDHFDSLPQTLREQFAEPVFVMAIVAAKHKLLTGVAMEVIQKHLSEVGYYFYIPPPIKTPLPLRKAGF
tara:strand:+ start:362 stop:634 length:273 start_codon:yes stop_codon:yes gene_type:complete